MKGRGQGPASAAPGAAGIGQALPMLVLLCLIWGYSYVALKIGQQWTGPWTMAGLRALLAGLGMVLLALVLRRPAPRDPATWRRLASIGLLNVTGLQGAMSLGITQVSAGETALLIYTQPLLVALLAAPLLGERLTRRHGLGLALGFLGMVIVLLPRLQSVGTPAWAAYAILLGGAGSWALSAVLMRRWQRQAGSPLAAVDIIWLTGLQALAGSLPLLLVAGLVEGWRLTPHGELLWTLAYLGLLATGLNNIIWFSLLRRYTVVLAVAPVFLIPALAALFGALALGEALHANLIIGGLLTMAGIALVTRTR